jgi:hypothetical protein
MTALALRALAFAEQYGITIAVVASDRLSWQSRGPTPGRALEALKAAKGELIDLLVRFRLDAAGGLAGDDLLATLRVKGFAVRRYGVNAALDDALGGALQRAPTASLLYAFADRQAEYSALRALGASNCLEGNCPQSGVATTEDCDVLVDRPRGCSPIPSNRDRPPLFRELQALNSQQHVT